MTDLEFFKEHWNKQNDFPLKTKEELKNIIKKSSSNILKWLIATNLFELVFFISINYFFGNQNLNELTEKEIKLFGYIDYIIYSLPVFFSIYFIYLISKISGTESISNLISSILNARKMLNTYIYINIAIFIMIVYYGVFSSINAIDFNDPEYSGLSHTTLNIILIVSCIIVSSAFMFLIWLFYKLLYGRFLERLNKNYNQLIDME